MRVDRIERDVLINASPRRVWAALTSAEHLGTWFGDAGATVSALEPGGEVTLTWAEHGTGRAIIEKVEPESFFSWRWSGPLGPDPVPGNATLVEFTLTPTDGGTLLQVVESGFTGLDLPSEGQEKYASGNFGGWGHELDELREYLET
ncbi:activator of HSP90 ATPase [Lentzea sp. NEAU-D13]|uniref:Activator of HSP90 ATPase n=1 Tax=Lentzea alba TaxID=2714351 RepID=A0A7C9RSX1_9PSEU|nr:activator of HSP90 ATPase [Lentzea alba]